MISSSINQTGHALPAQARAPKWLQPGWSDQQHQPKKVDAATQTEPVIITYYEPINKSQPYNYGGFRTPTTRSTPTSHFKGRNFDKSVESRSSSM